MTFFYDITQTNPNSGQYEVFVKGHVVGLVIQQGNIWLAIKIGNNYHENLTFSSKEEAAQYLANLAGIN
jgi:hypothetical protein